MKTCSKCKIEKPLTEFHKRNNRPSGYASSCKKCRTKEKRSPDYIRNYDLKKSYGITLDDYNSMFEEQGGKCAICKIHLNDIRYGKKKNLCVDHDHKTGKVRGLLCDKCNRGIGLLKDDVNVLNNAINYLKRNE